MALVSRAVRASVVGTRLRRRLAERGKLGAIGRRHELARAGKLQKRGARAAGGWPFFTLDPKSQPVIYPRLLPIGVQLRAQVPAAFGARERCHGGRTGEGTHAWRMAGLVGRTVGNPGLQLWSA